MIPNTIAELRRYRLHPGARDILIDLFDREFVESQEALGIRVVGQFRDIDQPDHFVWLRSFADMASRADALGRFYDGPVWAAHRDEANGTMINSDNVLLLRPATPDSGFAPATGNRPPPGSNGASTGLVVCTICYLPPDAEDDFREFFERSVRPSLIDASANVLAAFVAERSPNTFARLPVRAGESVFVWLCGFPDLHDYLVHTGRLARSAVWTGDVVPEMARRTWRATEVSRLVPTARSLLRG
jgi:hypothetical protein